jgi:hypothetical protein
MESASSFFQVSRRLYIARFDSSDADQMAKHIFLRNYIVVPSVPDHHDSTHVTDNDLAPSCLEEIYKFGDTVDSIMRANPNEKIVLAVGTTLSNQQRVAFLFGCHLITSKEMEAEQVISSFNGYDEVFNSIKIDGLGLHTYWRALSFVKNLSWINFHQRLEYEESCNNHDKIENRTSIDMEEYEHYSR